MSACKSLMAAYAAAVLAKDAARLAALYADDVAVFDAWGVWRYDRAGWVHALHNWLGSLGDESVRITFDEVRSVERPGVGWMSAIVSYASFDLDGGALNAMQNRLSWALVEDGGVWRIAHEHTSAPIDFDSQKAMLRRE